MHVQQAGCHSAPDSILHCTTSVYDGWHSCNNAFNDAACTLHGRSALASTCTRMGCELVHEKPPVVACVAELRCKRCKRATCSGQARPAHVSVRPRKQLAWQSHVQCMCMTVTRQLAGSLCVFNTLCPCKQPMPPHNVSAVARPCQAACMRSAKVDVNDRDPRSSKVPKRQNKRRRPKPVRQTPSLRSKP